MVLSRLAGSLHTCGRSRSISASLCTYRMANYTVITLLKYLGKPAPAQGLGPARLPVEWFI